jgi:hypothetical protein
MEDFLRLDLDPTAPRRFVVARPIALDVIGGPDPYMVDVSNHPKVEAMDVRPVELSSEMWLDADDVRPAGSAEKGFKRVEPGAVFRVMPGLVLVCESVIVDEEGTPVRVVCKPSDGKPRTTIHGLSRSTAVPVEIWEPDVIEREGDDPDSKLVIRSGFAEPSAMGMDSAFHAVRYGYCVADRKSPGRLILTVKLKSSF